MGTKLEMMLGNRPHKATCDLKSVKVTDTNEEFSVVQRYSQICGAENGSTGIVKKPNQWQS